jgi:hypothetical protein
MMKKSDKGRPPRFLWEAARGGLWRNNPHFSTRKQACDLGSAVHPKWTRPLVKLFIYSCEIIGIARSSL